MTQKPHPHPAKNSAVKTSPAIPPKKPQPLPAAYRTLDRIFHKGAYLGDALGEEIFNLPESEKPRFTFLVYGVLDRSFELDYIVDKCCKNPKPAARLLLKMGTYLGRYSRMPVYAATDEIVSLCRELGYAGLCGFVNATLKNCISYEIVYPSDSRKKLSIQYSFPLWIVQKYLRQYGEDAEKLLAYRPKSFEHIRIRIPKTEFVKKLEEAEIPYEDSPLTSAVYADYGKLFASKLDSSEYTKMSYGSMMICSLAEGFAGGEILDACAAPGGKSCYLADLFPDSAVTACDIHPHRLELIRSYAGRLKLANVMPKLSDASVYVPEFEGRFGLVLADVPCSGLGTVYSKPDVKLNRTPEDIPELSQLQENILNNLSKYVSQSGILVYSTCTTLREENEDVVFRFLRDHPEFEKLAEEKVNPIVSDSEGFYMVKLKRM